MTASPRAMLSMRKVLLALAVVLLPLARARADRIELRTGEVLVGKILRNNEEEVSIRLATGGVLSFKWSVIRRIRKGSETYESSEQLPTPSEQRPTAKKKSVTKPVTKPVAPSERTTKPPPAASGAAPRDMEPPGPKVVSPRVPAVEHPGPIENSVTDEERGFSIAPPKGFVPRPESQSEVVPLAFVDPFTRATFTVSAYPSKDTVLQLKKSTLRSLTDNFSAFRVLRDEKVRRDGKDVEPEAWLVEVESKVGATSVRQIQVFTKSECCVVILSYSATLDSYARHEEAFEWSLLSFRAVPVAVPESAAPATTRG